MTDDGKVVHSPIAVQRMMEYRARMATLVKAGHLTQEEAQVLYHAKFTGIIDKLGNSKIRNLGSNDSRVLEFPKREDD